MSARPPILVIGKSGQVACALARCTLSSSLEFICLGRPQLDICNPDSLEAAFKDIRPALVINAAAYTAVDRAEEEKDAAHQINAEGPANLANLCAAFDLPLIHLSTDYVFNGDATRPYKSDDPIDPQSVYGASKAAGEEAVRQALKKHIIIRTAWVYGINGHNFVKTMLKLGETRDQLSIVDDQTGSPTYADDIATALERIAVQIVQKPDDISWGTYHLTNRGETTWFGFASEIFRLAEISGHPVPDLTPITTQQYPTPAHRPKYSVLELSGVRDDFGIELPLWQVSLKRCLDDLFQRERENKKEN
jgi:dTDP-4-dehydrorhamnose reductase